jgi:hypothetical protein
MSAVFISYRRSDSAGWSAKLSNHLRLRFGDDIVFRDVDSLRPGVRWRRELDTALHGAVIVLVLIGPSWFKAPQRRRLANPKDVLRQEIATALRSPRRKVVPVLLGGASLPDPDALPRPLRMLTAWETCSLRERQWRRDVENLVERLRELVPGLGGLTLSRIHDRLQREEDRYFELLPQDPRRALAVARATMRGLNRFCPHFPQDALLQLRRGYCHKNIAMAQRQLGHADEARAALDEAELTFRTALSERPDDASAWNGLGSVAAVRGQRRKALRLVDNALKLEPTYPAALRDREQLLAVLRAR